MLFEEPLDRDLYDLAHGSALATRVPPESPGRILVNCNTHVLPHNIKIVRSRSPVKTLSWTGILRPAAPWLSVRFSE